MEKITEQTLLNFYNDTLNKCGIFLLKEDDETIEYCIYEDFDIGIHSFFHINNLQRLYNSNLISLEKLNESVLLRSKVINLQNNDEWGFEHFKTSKRWKEIMILSDKIKSIV
ncbi:hypothetical protein [Tellurirhabdus rosea]|uniref:hypothetical protein n=1 Tax=Tellurirhabdus rosea TaxID=2674997 RepID=UPI00225154F8|nr:hypothetical protein [Tellurirhabdus rosea]